MNLETVAFTTRIERPADEVMAWHERPGAFARLCPPWERVEVISATGGVRNGARVVLRTRLLFGWQRWEVEHRDYVAGRQFRDVQLSSPFAAWEHLHRVEPDGANACHLTDTITYRLPGGSLGRVFARGFVERKLARLFRWRHLTTKTDLELTTQYGHVAPQRVVIAGASGLMGRALVSFLQTQGHPVIRLVRRSPRTSEEIQWDPASGTLDPRALEGVEVIVNLSGENVAGGRWTRRRREQILKSRVEATRTLVESVRKLERLPSVWVNASAVGYYGDRSDAALSETEPLGAGSLPGVVLAWETHASGAAQLGFRTALMRFGVVLSPAGGALAKLLPVFRAGLGGRLGSGHQWLSWVSIDDAVGAIYHAIRTPACAGPINVVSPHPVTNAGFTATLGEVLHRPAVMAVPAWALRTALGAMAEETLLASTRVLPTRLRETGYRFRHPELGPALAHVLGSTYRLEPKKL